MSLIPYLAPKIDVTHYPLERTWHEYRYETVSELYSGGSKILEKFYPGNVITNYDLSTLSDQNIVPKYVIKENF